MQSSSVLFSILLLSYACAPSSTDKEAASDNVSAKMDSIVLPVKATTQPEDPEPEALPADNAEQLKPPALIHLFEDPIDLRTYKIKKRGANSSATRKRTYFHQPDTVGTHYKYFWFHNYRRDPAITNAHDAVMVNTYIYGDTITTYEEVNEALISIKGMVEDPDLGRLNVVGLTRPEVHERFGEAQITFKDLYVYEHRKDILILSFQEDQVAWFNFVRTNLELASIEDLPPELKYHNERIPVTK